MAQAGQGRQDHALADLGRALELTPDNIELLLDRGKLYFNVGRLDEAMADATRVIELAPRGPQGYNNRGACYALLKQYDRAIADLTKCLELRPTGANTWRNLGNIHALVGQHEASIADFTKAIEVEPGVPNDLMKRAHLFIRVERFAEAVADLTRLMDFGDASPLVVMRRGMCYEIIGAESLALADYESIAARDGLIAKYAALWKHLLLRSTGDATASGGLLASKTPSEGESGHAWIDRIFDLFDGNLTPDQLLQAAVTDDERAEAYYYIARKALLDGPPDNATAAFIKCLELERDELLETDFARASLKQLQDVSGH